MPELQSCTKGMNICKLGLLHEHGVKAHIEMHCMTIESGWIQASNVQTYINKLMSTPNIYYNHIQLSDLHTNQLIKHFIICSLLTMKPLVVIFLCSQRWHQPKEIYPSLHTNVTPFLYLKSLGNGCSHQITFKIRVVSLKLKSTCMSTCPNGMFGQRGQYIFKECTSALLCRRPTQAKGMHLLLGIHNLYI